MDYNEDDDDEELDDELDEEVKKQKEKAFEDFDKKNYFKDGFVPAIKAISNLTKSMQNLSDTKKSESDSEE